MGTTSSFKLEIPAGVFDQVRIPASEMEPTRRFVFFGKAAIYSAGVTFMSFFARANRYLARGTRLIDVLALARELRTASEAHQCQLRSKTDLARTSGSGRKADIRQRV